MTIKMLQTLALLFIAIHGSYGKHFRGGSMSWKPLTGNKVEVTYRIAFKYAIDKEPVFEPCTDEALEARTVLRTGDDLVCKGCSGDQAERPFDYICDDIDKEQDSTLGSYVWEYDVPSGQSKLLLSYESCCWLSVVSPDLRTGSRGWNMSTEVDITPRKDGRINSSPITSPIPVEKYYQGCTYNLQIAVSDPDNDHIKCKTMKPEECNSNEKKRRACGKETSGLTLLKNCTMVFDAATAGVGYHAVNVMIRDCPNSKCKPKPYSKIPLLFLLEVAGEADVCMKPTIIIPPSCKMIPPEQPFEMVVMAEAGDPSKPISRITAQKPFGMTSSDMEPVEDYPNRMAIKLSWTPTPDQIKEHSVCFSALDSDGFTSGRYCTFIIVSDQLPLSPDPEASTPAKGAQHKTGEKWVIRFNNPIQKPQKNAFIHIVDKKGRDTYNVSVRSKDVTFTDTTIEFTPPQANFPFSAAPVPYTVRLDEGVAAPMEGGCMSETSKWKVFLKDSTDFAILPMENCRSSMGPVDPQSCDVYLHQMTLDDNENVVDTKYNLCCTCVGTGGSAYAPGPPGGPPAGPPGPPGGR